MMTRISFLLFCGILNNAEAQVSSPYSPEGEITQSFLTSRTIDVSRPVGVVAGNPSVSATGGAAYSIPLVVAPGTNGVQPQLGLVYNSQSGDGPLGWGWSLAGLSAIVRTGTDWYHDQPDVPVRGITFTSTDRFMVDGQRMISTAGTYGAANSTYDSENASFGVYTAHGSTGGVSGPLWFSVITKAGMYMEYGATADSRATIGNGDVYSWSLSKVMDPNGNYMTYEYENIGGEHVVRSIKYTGNAAISMAPYNEVRFLYADRSDRNELFVFGLGGLHTTRLLTAIEMYSEGERFKVYTLNYSLRDKTKSYLREITECTGNGSTCFNSTVIKYGGPAWVPFYPEYFMDFGDLDGEGYDYYSGDFDGDGRSEILVSPYEVTETNGHANTGLYVYKRTGVGVYSTLWSTPLDPDVQLVNEKWTHPFAHAANLSCDMNGDGRDDIVLATAHDEGASLVLQDITIYESNATAPGGFEQHTYPPPLWNSASHKYLPEGHRYIVPSDFDGDGRSDLLLIARSYSGYYTAFLYRPNNGTIWQWQQVDGNADFLANASTLLPIDHDGDGAQEILAVGDNESRIYRKTATGFEIVWYSGGFPTPGHLIYPGDFNGDGKTDILTRYGPYGEWNISYFNGDGYLETPFPQLTATGNGTGYENQINVGDFNGDGRSDVCWAHPSGGSGFDLSLFYSRGMGQSFAQASHHVNHWGANPGTVTDVNGDGRSEVINTGNISGDPAVCLFDALGHERSVDQIVNGMNATVNFDYSFLTTNGEVLTNADFTYPNGRVKLPMEVTYTMAVANGIGGLNVTGYNYHEATMNRTGKGFLGFGLIESIDHAANKKSIQHSSLDVNFPELVPRWQELRRYDTDELLTRSEQDIHLVWMDLMPPRRYWAKPKTIIVTDALAGTTTTTNNDCSACWDSYGNLKKTITDIAGVETVMTETHYVAAGPSSVPAKPDMITLTRTRAGQPTVTKSVKNTYNSSTGELLTTTDLHDTPAAVTTTMFYNPAGTLQSTTRSFPGLAAGEEQKAAFEYESKHRFVNKRTKRWNHNGSLVEVTDEIRTEPRFGNVVNTLGADGLKTDMIYDGFGRLSTSLLPYVNTSPRGETSYVRD